MKTDIAFYKDTCLIHAVEFMAVNLHGLTLAVDPLHGEEEVVCPEAGYQGSEKRAEMHGKIVGFWVAMHPGRRLALPDTPEGRLDDLIEMAKAHIRAKGKHPIRLIKCQFFFQKTRLRGMLKNRCTINALAALANLFLMRSELLCMTLSLGFSARWLFKGTNRDDGLKIW